MQPDSTDATYMRGWTDGANGSPRDEWATNVADEDHRAAYADGYDDGAFLRAWAQVRAVRRRQAMDAMARSLGDRAVGR